MDDPLATIDSDNLALATLEGAMDDMDLIVFSQSHGSDVVFGSELGGDRCTHEDSPSRPSTPQFFFSEIDGGWGFLVLFLLARYFFFFF